jgi:hypothetical protein
MPHEETYLGRVVFIKCTEVSFLIERNYQCANFSVRSKIRLKQSLPIIKKTIKRNITNAQFMSLCIFRWIEGNHYKNCLEVSLKYFIFNWQSIKSSVRSL